MKYINNKDFNNSIIKYNKKKTKIKYIYIYTSLSKNYIYFICNKRRQCKGGAKIDKIKKV